MCIFSAYYEFKVNFGNTLITKYLKLNNGALLKITAII